MKETARISRLLGQLYNGDPWIDVHLLAALKKVSGKQAATKILPNCNSIWEITNHLIGWRENILERIQGNIAESPADNYFRSITDDSEEAWMATLNRLDRSQRNWIDLLDRFDPAKLDTSFPPSPFSSYDLAHGIIQHDAYHLGQIVLLVKQFH
jgi:uncharacterized damage-inducible protein DinB